MGRSEEFLDLYKEMEEMLVQRFAEAGRRTSSVVMDFLNTEEGLPFREDLNFCREVRNVLAHHASIRGEAVVEPAEALLDVIRQVLDFLKKPQPALAFATPRERMLTTTPGQQALKLMREMQKNGFSHVPVFRYNKLDGVFSISTVFSYLLKPGAGPITEETEVQDFGSLLRIGQHDSERFEVVDKDTDYWTVLSLFNRKADGPRKRLAVIFITDDGTLDGHILGMITPWDLIAHRMPHQTEIPEKFESFYES